MPPRDTLTTDPDAIARQQRTDRRAAMKSAKNIPVSETAYFSFGEIAEKAATRPGSMTVTAQALDRAYRELFESAVNGAFSCLMWWWDGLQAEYTPELLVEAHAMNDWSSFRDNWMNHIHVPRDDAQRWFSSRTLTLPPEWFPEKSGSAAAKPTKAPAKPKRQKPGPKPGPWQQKLRDLLRRFPPTSMLHLARLTWPQQYDFITKKANEHQMALTMPVVTSGSAQAIARRIIAEVISLLPDKPPPLGQ